MCSVCALLTYNLVHLTNLYITSGATASTVGQGCRMCRRCRKVGEAGSQQLLLDTQAIKALLLDLPSAGAPAAARVQGWHNSALSLPCLLCRPLQVSAMQSLLSRPEGCSREQDLA